VEQADVVVIGAGVVGLAIARELSKAGREVLLLEQEETIGTGVSSRNSEVVHGGLYYRQNSLKAKLCVEGRRMLTSYCKERSVNIRACGKIVVADQDAQVPQLLKLKEQGERNGLDDLRLLNKVEIQALEPEVHGAVGLLSPSSGIVDSHQFMLALQGDCEAYGGTLIFRTAVASGHTENDRVIVTTSGTDAYQLSARLVVNSAGLGAQAIAHSFVGLNKSHIPPLHLAKGSYFSLSGNSPFSRLVYPMPEPGGLGVHFTLDLAGAGRFGPDVEWVNAPNYDVDIARRDAFCTSISRYWSGVTPEMLLPAYAGIRPKVERPGGSHTDFMIQGPAQHGYPRLINLYGIESPGLTASMAIAKFVAIMAQANST
jgi:L-2-hydroxyglutarate oxidase LhgO